MPAWLDRIAQWSWRILVAVLLLMLMVVGLVSLPLVFTPIVLALEAQQIAVAGVDLVPLAQLSIVRDLVALTQAVDHLGDRTAWLAILRAALGRDMPILAICRGAQALNARHRSPLPCRTGGCCPRSAPR